MYDSILVPTDGSGGEQQFVEEAISLAELTGATVHVLHVVDSGLAESLSESTQSMVHDDLKTSGETAVSSIEGSAERAGLETNTAIVSGNPADEIVNYAEENDIDAIVMGTHANTGVSHLVLGSVTERVIRLTTVPVLAVNLTEHHG
ncbi:universal stress protein [Haladaptatus sp. CMAA 1911]|uniref:universal stress protein n=1 Tax=unclassified Haladaptatus TaxID=2622732 RepID=UPI003754A98E